MEVRGQSTAGAERGGEVVPRHDSSLISAAADVTMPSRHDGDLLLSDTRVS